MLPTLLIPPETMPVSVLTDADYAAAAAILNCEVAAIKAVAHVETGERGPFQSDGLPTILFEQRVFSRLTNHAYDATHPHISSTAYGGYGKFSEQYGKLAEAAALNEADALESCSWGAFQIMGENHAMAGFKDVESMVASMRLGVASHLQAFTNFIRNGRRLPTAIQSKDWNTFAYNYNGPRYQDNDYAGKLAAAYASFA